MKIYLSGGITKVGVENARRTFDEYERVLGNVLRCEVLNPMKAVPQKEGKGWWYYMVRLLPKVVQCDEIYMMPNWGESRGARLERIVAMLFGLEVRYAKLRGMEDGNVVLIVSHSPIVDDYKPDDFNNNNNTSDGLVY